MDGPISDRTLSTQQFTSGESVSRHVFMQMMDILNTFCVQTCTICIFSCVLV